MKIIRTLIVALVAVGLAAPAFAAKHHHAKKAHKHAAKHGHKHIVSKKAVKKAG